MDEEKSLRKKNIMISYAWKQRDKDISSLPRKVCLFLIVVWRRRIASELKKRGYNVWIDVRGMRGDIDDVMAQAVKWCDVFLACISEAYEASDNCRIEISMAKDRNKKIFLLQVEQDFQPDGWLHVHTTRKYIYDFTKWNRKTKVSELRGSREFNKKLNELVKHIEKDIPVLKSFDNFNAETSSDSDEDEVSSKLFSEMDLNKCSSLHSCQETEDCKRSDETPHSATVGPKKLSVVSSDIDEKDFVLATRLTDELRKDLNVLFQDKLFEEHKTSGETSAFQSNDLKKQPSIFYADNACDTTEEISEEIDEQIDFPEDVLTDEDGVAHLKLNTSIIISYAPMQNGIDISHIPVQIAEILGDAGCRVTIKSENVEKDTGTCDFFLAFVSDGYLNNDECKSQISKAFLLRKKIIIIQVVENFDPYGTWLHALVEGKICYDLSKWNTALAPNVNEESEEFWKAIEALLTEF